MFTGLLFKMLLKEIFFFVGKKLKITFPVMYMHVHWFILVLGIGNSCDFLDENKLYFTMLQIFPQ